MRKADALRAAIVAAFPDLAAQPQQLKIWLETGKVIAVRRPGEGERMEYRYRLQLLLTDFAGSADLLFATIALFLAVEQPSIGLVAGGAAGGFDFQVDILDEATSDVLIGVDLTESVEKQGDEFVHLAEPTLDDDLPVGPGAGFAKADLRWSEE